MSDEKSVAGRTGHHTDHGQPDVDGAVWRIATIANTQHV